MSTITCRSSKFDLSNRKFKDKKILIVEDNMTNRLFLSVMMDEFGIETVEVENGQEAVDIFKKEKFDLVLMDEEMPVMSGMDATRIIRSYEDDKHSKSTPIIAVSSNTQKGDKEGFLRVGMNEYLPKPIKKEILLVTIEKFLKD
ncbi:MAG: response regulator [Helicobacteraceae bacterium]|nr:response regulator [Helicobacteraceae bacterium]